MERSSFGMSLLIILHDFFMEVLIGVLVLVLLCVVLVIRFRNLCIKIERSHYVEFFWTVIPIFVIFFLATPSFLVLFSMEDVSSKLDTLSLKGMQWDWEVRFFSDSWEKRFSNQGKEVYSLNLSIARKQGFRLLDRENCIFVEKRVPLLFQLGSEDVIHSFTVPSLGFKMDCIPGKSSDAIVTIFKSGIFHGHCAEICGANHSIMPFVLVAS